MFFDFLGKYYYVLEFFTKIRYSYLILAWDIDLGCFFIWISIGLLYYFVLLGFLNKVLIKYSKSDYFCSFKTNQINYDYDKFGTSFYGIFFMICIQFMLLFFFLFYQFFVRFFFIKWVLIPVGFVKFLIYFITFFNTIVLVYFFNYLRPYYYSGAQKFYWFFNFIRASVLAVWSAGVIFYFLYCMFLVLFFTMNNTYLFSSVENLEYKNKGFDLYGDITKVRRYNNSKSLSSVVEEINKSKRK